MVKKPPNTQSSLGFALALMVIGVLLLVEPWFWQAFQDGVAHLFLVAGYVVIGFGAMGAGLDLDRRLS